MKLDIKDRKIIRDISTSSIQPTTNAPSTLLYYNVYRSTTPGGPYSLLASNVQRQYYRDESASNGINYYYVVTAYYDTGEGNFSNEDNGQPVLDGYVINSGYTFIPPNLDGIINSPEWGDATIIDMTFPGLSPPVTLYVMNDDGNLYVAVDDPGNLTLEDYDQIGIYFHHYLQPVSY